MVYLLADEIAAHTMLLLLPPLGHVDSIKCAALHAWAKLFSLQLESSVDAAQSVADIYTK
ncbi:hypothetical protein EXN22_00580 [Pseudomonas tructae]|uniref:Uncharacterized protein n=1 Tax=Pseudomonas tructae TaxID=2518644 RepID=A0A411MQF3_9PSED|nr:hypothetical protein EXN22_00580 [Pseudomonas tructae]